MNSRYVVMHHSRTQEQKAVHKKILDDNVCPFCWKNIKKYHSKPIIEKTNSWLVTENAWPYEGTEQHFLIIHKKHITHINKLKEKDYKDLFILIKKYSHPSGGAFFMRFGDTDTTGASVSHLHFHIIKGGKRKNSKSQRLLVQLGYKK